MDINEAATILGPRFEVVANDGGLVLGELDLPAGARVLDVGTGNGTFAIYLALRGFDVLTGEPSTDTSHYAGKDWAVNARKLGVLERIRFQAFDASEMPFESASFDAVFFFGVLHHVDADDREAVLREAVRVAKPDGAVVLFEPNRAMLEKIRADDPGHPEVANPFDYLTEPALHARKIDGAWMDIFVYGSAAARGRVAAPSK
jgi:SAM-dependent methyltransferase